MNLLQRLLKEKIQFEGVVVSATLNSFSVHPRTGRIVMNYCCYNVNEHLGYDKDGIPIKDSYTVGRFKVKVQNANGAIKEFDHYGRQPKIGSTQKYEY